MLSNSWFCSLALLAVLGCGSQATDETPDRSSGNVSNDGDLPADPSSDDDSQGVGPDPDPSDDTGAPSEPSDDPILPTDPNVDDDPPPMPREPANHRATAEVCDDVRPPGNVSEIYQGEGTPCAKDEDCTDGVNGRCVDRRGPSCTYDECFSDSECSTGGPCGCEQGFWSDYNTCMAGNCQVDADCGEGGFCSPSFGSCGAYSGVVGYWCRTPNDTCVEDSDCVDPTRGAGYCARYPEVSYWACQYGQCVG